MERTPRQQATRVAIAVFVLQTVGSGVAVYGIPIYIAVFLRSGTISAAALSIAGTVAIAALGARTDPVLVGELLRLFTLNKTRITAAEAVAQVGLNRTTVHRYFTSLVQADILERDRDEAAAFVPGKLLLQLGAVARGQRRVLDIAPSRM